MLVEIWLNVGKNKFETVYLSEREGDDGIVAMVLVDPTIHLHHPYDEISFY